MYLFILIFFYHDCIFINFYSNAAHKFPVYGTIKLYCIVLYCIIYKINVSEAQKHIPISRNGISQQKFLLSYPSSRGTRDSV